MSDAGRAEQSVKLLHSPEVDIVAVPGEKVTAEGPVILAVVIARRHLAVIIDHPAGA